ncbi:MAG: hypothetical protein ABIO70_00440 [Pseudomonadota bacterium]
MKKSLPALVALAAFGCSRSPHRPAVDIAAALPDVDALIGGTFSGTVVDGSEEGQEPCPIAGQAWTLAFTVQAPVGCGDQEGHEEDSGSDCSSAEVGGFPLDGQLTLAGAAAGAVEGSVRAESTEQGLLLTVNLSPPPGDYPRQTFDADQDGGLAGEATVAGFVWGRRLSEDDAAEVVWEVCALPADRHDP